MGESYGTSPLTGVKAQHNCALRKPKGQDSAFGSTAVWEKLDVLWNVICCPEFMDFGWDLEVHTILKYQVMEYHYQYHLYNLCIIPGVFVAILFSVRLLFRYMSWFMPFLIEWNLFHWSNRGLQYIFYQWQQLTHQPKAQLSQEHHIVVVLPFHGGGWIAIITSCLNNC